MRRMRIAYLTTMKLDPIIPVWILIPVLALLAGGITFYLIKSREEFKTKALAAMPLLTALILMLVVGLRPMREERNAEIRLSNLDVLLVVDTTVSMWADDYSKGVRMDGAKATCTYIMDSLPGANFALVTFDNHSFIRAPFTQDRETLDSLLENIDELSPWTTLGSDMNIPYNDIRSLLISSSKKENRKAVVFFLSDGEITTKAELQSYAELKDLVSGGAVLGFGTPEGGKMKYEYGYVYDNETYKDAVSVIDEETLRTIADGLGIEYTRVSNPLQAGQAVTKVKSMNDDVLTRSPGIVTYHDTYYYYTFPLLLLLIAQLFLTVLPERRS